MESTRDRLRELRALSGQAHANLYRRIMLADTILDDLDWIATEHGGSDLKAQEALSQQFFADLDGYISLGKLRAMFRNVPKPEWESCRWNLAAIEAVYDGQADPKPSDRNTRISWKTIAEQRQDTIEKLRRENDRLRLRVAELETNLAQTHVSV